MSAVLRVEATIPKKTGVELAARRPSSVMAGLQWLIRLFSAVFVSGVRVRTQVDESTGVKATGTVTLTQANLTVGDIVGIGDVALVAVTGTASATAGTWSKDTSATAAATSLAAAINGYPPLKGRVTATSAVGVVTITAFEAGTVGNSIRLSEKDAAAGIALSGSLLTGGIDPCSLPTVALTFSGTGTANDTITIGGVVLTLVASAANENQITIGGSAAASATNTIAVINAHTKLKGLVLASSGGSGIVSCQLQFGGRMGNLVGLAEAGTGTSWAATSFTPSTTEAWAGSIVTYTLGTV